MGGDGERSGSSFAYLDCVQLVGGCGPVAMWKESDARVSAGTASPYDHGGSALRTRNALAHLYATLASGRSTSRQQKAHPRNVQMHPAECWIDPLDDHPILIRSNELAFQRLAAVVVRHDGSWLARRNA